MNDILKSLLKTNGAVKVLEDRLKHLEQLIDVICAENCKHIFKETFNDIEECMEVIRNGK